MSVCRSLVFATQLCTVRLQQMWTTEHIPNYQNGTRCPVVWESMIPIILYYCMKDGDTVKLRYIIIMILL